MSSFVIDKIEFVKAAGLMYGIEESKRYSHRWWLERVRGWFVDAYRMNVSSVAEQYGEEDEGDTEPDYDETFEEYRKKGYRIWSADGWGNVPLTRKELRNSLMKFFQSVCYQVENDEMLTKIQALFFTCICKMSDEDVDDIDGWWGEIEI